MNKLYYILTLLVFSFIGILLFRKYQDTTTLIIGDNEVLEESTEEEVNIIQQDIITVPFEELGITMDVPIDLELVKTPYFVNESNSELESYTFYLQERKETGEIGFQIYGLYQFSLPEVTWEELSKIEEDDENYEYVNEIEINGLKGYETKLTGERGNYVYMFLLDNRVLRIAVSPGTISSKERADIIINTLTVLE